MHTSKQGFSIAHAHACIHNACLRRFYKDGVKFRVHADRDEASRMKHAALAFFRVSSLPRMSLAYNVIPWADDTVVSSLDIVLPPRKYLVGLFEVPFWTWVSKDKAAMTSFKWTAKEMESIVKR